jgi:hypothetical protein
MIARIKSKVRDFLRSEVTVGAKSAELLAEPQGVAKLRQDTLTEPTNLGAGLVRDSKTGLQSAQFGDIERSLGRPYDTNVPIVFMHIPKTSGTALAAGLRYAVAPRREIGGFDTVLFGGFCAFDTIPTHVRNSIYLDVSDVPADGDFVAAHMAFSTLHSRYGVANYLTVLREPLSRILSHWLYWRALSSEQLSSWGNWAEYAREAMKPLEHFLSCRLVACHTDNLSVRMLLWPHPLIPDDDFIDPRNDEALLEDAIKQLCQFSFSDVIENPDMLISLQRWLGRPVPYVPINETPPVPSLLKRPLHAELTTKATVLLETRARLDQRLWTLLAKHRISRVSAETLQRRAILRNAMRHSFLMET